ncbi:hypothetical protein [Frateuria defendens]|uniref:hypothetical protein n=1 Tax=Frateuria defendens TaxID=2219559 RepID=UPI0012931747|nr:hypothetical protein [Frateuria defendens]
MRPQSKLTLAFLTACVVAAAYAYAAHWAPATDNSPSKLSDTGSAAPISVNQSNPPDSAAITRHQADVAAPHYDLRNAEAADAFTEARTCIRNADKLRTLALRKEQCAHAPQDASAAAECSGISKELSAAEQASLQSSCSNDPVRLQQSLTEATAAAARAGNADAQLCFIDGGYYPTDEASIRTYGPEAAEYLKNGLARGDWRIVQTLATPPDSYMHRGQALGGQVYIGLPFTAYRATRLLLLGATGPYALVLQQKSKSYATALTPAQVANANEWAKEEFRRHFSHSDLLRAPPPTCLTE